LKSSLLSLAAALAVATPLAAQTPELIGEGAQPTPMPAPIAAPRDVAYPGTLKLYVDATDLERRIFRVRETIPITGSGPVTILYPQWVPGGHSPRNALYNVTGLTFRAGGQVVPWKRDPVQVFAFHVTPPAGATSVEVEFQFVTPDRLPTRAGW
jgi:hypothetical protein